MNRNKSAAKQHERNEKNLRNLSKLPSNRICMDCPQKGPHLYICLNFNTFICSNCSGLHRKFPGHRVKSISLSTFTNDEVQAIEASGGNEAARNLWLYHYRSSKDSPEPPADNLAKIEEFMKAVYIEGRWKKGSGNPRREVVEHDSAEEPAPKPTKSKAKKEKKVTPKTDPFGDDNASSA